MSSHEICFPISKGELARRHGAVRAAMNAISVDVLIMQNNNDFHGGYVKWFTDIPAVYGGYFAVMFPLTSGMVLVAHGAPREAAANEAETASGIAKIITRPTFAAADFTKHYQAICVAEEIRMQKARRVGLVGTTSMSAAFLDAVRHLCGEDIEFIDVTDAVDRIKAIKSEEELALIRQCAALQDDAFDAVMEAIQPGMRCFELTALAQHVGQLRGSEQGLFLANASLVGAPRMMNPRHFQNAILEKGSVLTILIENNGPGGFYCELGRTVVLGAASRSMRQEFDFALEAQKRTLGLLRPGAKPADILKSHNQFMTSHGRPEERRLYAHNQGYDLVERPLIAAEETIDIATGMNFAVHPTFLAQDALATVCDNYIITEEGVSECLHRTPQIIFEKN